MVGEYSGQVEEVVAEGSGEMGLDVREKGSYTSLLFPTSLSMRKTFDNHTHTVSMGVYRFQSFKVAIPSTCLPSCNE
jgi:hypothetical protein